MWLVMRAPFLAIGSLAICTRISWPDFSKSEMIGRSDVCAERRDGPRRLFGTPRPRCPGRPRSRPPRPGRRRAPPAPRRGGPRGGGLLFFFFFSSPPPPPPFFFFLRRLFHRSSS